MSITRTRTVTLTARCDECGVKITEQGKTGSVEDMVRLMKRKGWKVQDKGAHCICDWCQALKKREDAYG